MTALLFEMNKENMPEQQREKDLIDKISEFFINPNKDIAYSIRKRGEDEIEIRDSIFDWVCSWVYSFCFNWHDIH